MAWQPRRRRPLAAERFCAREYVRLEIIFGDIFPLAAKNFKNKTLDNQKISIDIAGYKTKNVIFISHIVMKLFLRFFKNVSDSKKNFLLPGKNKNYVMRSYQGFGAPANNSVTGMNIALYSNISYARQMPVFTHHHSLIENSPILVYDITQYSFAVVAGGYSTRDGVSTMVKKKKAAKKKTAKKTAKKKKKKKAARKVAKKPMKKSKRFGSMAKMAGAKRAMIIRL